MTAVFVDRDGVINRKAPEGRYVASWAEFEFLPGALEGLRVLAQAGLPVIVVTNQRGIARGALSEADLADIHRRMRDSVAAAGGHIVAVYHCPHEGGCDCRKPRPGMFEQAARDLRLRLTDTAVIGDRASDMLAAATIGAHRVLLPSDVAETARADHRAPDLVGAVTYLLGRRGESDC